MKAVGAFVLQKFPMKEASTGFILVSWRVVVICVGSHCQRGLLSHRPLRVSPVHRGPGVWRQACPPWCLVPAPSFLSPQAPACSSVMGHQHPPLGAVEGVTGQQHPGRLSSPTIKGV